VKSIKLPTGGGVRKSRFFASAMAFAASVALVTSGANSMDFLHTLRKLGRFADIVAVAAILFLMAVDTTQTE
jgi:hypothetical protein